MNGPELATWVQAFTTVVLAGITGYYAWQTRRQVNSSVEAVREMQLTREEQSRAYVTVELRPDGQAGWDSLSLAIRNYGAGAARDISVVFNPDVPQPQMPGRTLNELPLFRDLPFLAPRGEVRWHLGLLRNVRKVTNGGSAASVWQGKVTFTDTKKREQAFRLNIEGLEALRSFEPQGRALPVTKWQ